MVENKQIRTRAYPPFFGDLALSLQLGSGLSSLQDAMVLFGIDVQRFLLEHLSSRQGDTLHGGNCTTSRHHLIEADTNRGTVLRPSAIEGIHICQHTDTKK